MAGFTEFVEKYGIWVLLGILLVLFLILNYLNPVLVWDENAYMANARSHLLPSGTVHYTEDFRFPLLEYVIAGVWMITGESETAGRAVTVFFTLGLVYVFYLLLHYYFPKRALLYTVFFAFSPLMVIWGYKAYTEVMAAFFVILSFYLLLRGLLYENIWFLSAAGFVLGLGILSKFPIGLLGISVGIILLWKRKIIALTMFSLGTLLALLPWMLYNVITYHSPFWDFFAQYAIATYYGARDSTLFMLKNTIMMLGLIMIFTVIGFFSFFALSERKKKNIPANCILCLYVFLFFIYFYFIAKIKHDRYNLLLLPFIYILAYMSIAWIEHFIQNTKKRIIVSRIMLIVLTINALIVFSYQINEELYRARCQQQGAIQQTISYLDNHTTPGQTVSSNVWVWFGYSNNLRAIALWTEDLSYLLKKDQPAYIIYHNQIGEPYDENIFTKESNLVLEKTIKGLCEDETIVIYKIGTTS